MAHLEDKSFDMGMHAERLAGRTQKIFLSPTEDENFLYPDSFEVDFNERAEFDAAEIDTTAINAKIRELMAEGNVSRLGCGDGWSVQLSGALVSCIHAESPRPD